MKNKYTQKYTSIQDIYDIKENIITKRKDENELTNCMGWILRSLIQQGLIFIHMYDGSSIIPLQLIIEEKIIPDVYNSIINDIHSGACINVKGIIDISPAKGQKYEMKVRECKIIGKVTEPSTYLPCVKRPAIETIRSYHHLRPKFHI